MSKRAPIFDPIPADMRERVERILRAPADGVEYSPAEVAAAAAELEKPIESRQRALEFSPAPDVAKVYVAQNATLPGAKVLSRGRRRG